MLEYWQLQKDPIQSPNISYYLPEKKLKGTSVYLKGLDSLSIEVLIQFFKVLNIYIFKV